jgi:hypothetical protein
MPLLRVQRKLLRPKSPDLEMQTLSEAILPEGRDDLRGFAGWIGQVADRHVDDRQR